MDFSLSTEHEILRKSVKNFAEKEIKPVARELDEREEFSYDTMKAMAELGLFGVFVSEEYEGQGMDFVSYIIAIEEIARVDGSHAATIAVGNSLGIGPIYYYLLVPFYYLTSFDPVGGVIMITLSLIHI